MTTLRITIHWDSGAKTRYTSDSSDRPITPETLASFIDNYAQHIPATGNAHGIRKITIKRMRQS